MTNGGASGWFHHLANRTCFNDTPHTDRFIFCLQPQNKQPHRTLYVPTVLRPGRLCEQSIVPSLLGLCWEAASRSATQESPNVSRYPKVHYHAHTPVPIQSTPHVISQRSILMLSSCLCLGLPSSFPTKSYVYSSSPHTCYISCPSHSPLPDRSNCIWRRDGNRKETYERKKIML
jgi:hypothetical protein